METPYITHITAEDYEHVYEPAEDSFLMIDAIESDIEFLKILNPTFCLEIGSGSGINITAVSKAFKNLYCLATDINQYASRITKITSEVNKTEVDVISMDLVNCIKPNSIDLLLFNPPYVPTPSNEINFEASNNLDKNLIKSWAGGINGREIIDRVLKNLTNILSDNGVFYLLLIKENKPEEIVNELKQMKFSSNIQIERKIRGEHLYVLKIKRNKIN